MSVGLEEKCRLKTISYHVERSSNQFESQFVRSIKSLKNPQGSPCVFLVHPSVQIRHRIVMDDFYP